MQLNNKLLISIRQQPIEDMSELRTMIDRERSLGHEVSYRYLSKTDGQSIYQIMIHKAGVFKC